ncbi:hypothetical protein, partial [Porphyromonas cangingivalis]|uniref:hypothetical protein n=1 Tax=Porphyromonas cangingivalis TaxID=36874 RepID=UPI00242EF76D
ICGVEERNLSGEVSQGIAPPIGGDESSSPLVIYATLTCRYHTVARLFVSYGCYNYLSISIREGCQVLVCAFRRYREVEKKSLKAIDRL